jgi:hypothetical protein
MAKAGGWVRPDRRRVAARVKTIRWIVLRAERREHKRAAGELLQRTPAKRDHREKAVKKGDLDFRMAL